MALRVGQGRQLNIGQIEEPKSTGYDPAAQAAGYAERISAAGLDPTEATDDRNFIERALNLEQDQNLFFDIFEVIERPQQAIFGAWKAAQEGKDAGEAFMKGLTGKDETRFKEILMNYGMEDEKGKVNLVDVLGFAGDVLLDPADLAFIPMTGGVSMLANFKDVNKALKQGDNLATLIKASDGLVSSIDDVKNIMNTGRKAKKAIKAGDKSKEAIEAVSKLAKLQDTMNTAFKGQKFRKWMTPMQKIADKTIKSFKTTKASKKYATIADYVDEVQKTAKIPENFDYVEVEDLIKYIDADRVGAEASTEIDELTEFLDPRDELGYVDYEKGKDIFDRGFHVDKAPIQVFYDPQTGKLVVGEGNHRLGLAHALGIKKVPITIRSGVPGNLVHKPGQIAPGLFPDQLTWKGLRGAWVPKGDDALMSFKPTDEFKQALKTGRDSVPLNAGGPRWSDATVGAAERNMFFRAYDIEEGEKLLTNTINKLVKEDGVSGEVFENLINNRHNYDLVLDEIDNIDSELMATLDWYDDSEAQHALQKVKADYERMIRGDARVNRFLYKDDTTALATEIAQRRKEYNEIYKEVNKRTDEILAGINFKAARAEAITKHGKVIGKFNPETASHLVTHPGDLLINNSGEIIDATGGYFVISKTSDSYNTLEEATNIIEVSMQQDLLLAAEATDINQATLRKIIASDDGTYKIANGFLFDEAEVFDAANELAQYGHNVGSYYDAATKTYKKLPTKKEIEKLTDDRIISYFANEKNVKFIAPTDVVFKGTKKLLLATLDTTNKIVRKGLGFADSSGKRLRTYDDFVKGLKKTVSNMASASKETIAKAFQANGKKTFSKTLLTKKGGQITKDLDDIAKKLGMSQDEVYNQFLKFIEKDYVPKATGRQILENAADMPLTKAEIKQFTRLFSMDSSGLQKMFPGLNSTDELIDAMFETHTINGIEVWALKDPKLMEDVLKYGDELNELGQAVEGLTKYMNTLYPGRRLDKMFPGILPLNHKFIKDIDDLAAKYGDEVAGINIKKLYTRQGNTYVLNQNIVDELFEFREVYDIRAYELNKWYNSDTSVPRYTNLAKTEDELIGFMADANQVGYNLNKIADDYYDLLRINDSIMGTKIYKPNWKGYVRHALTEEGAEVAGKMTDSLVGKIPDSDMLKGNLQAFKSRKYQLPVEEANEVARWQAQQMLKQPNLSTEAKAFWESRANIDLFSELITDSISDIIQYAPEQAAAVRRMDAVLIEATFRNEDVFRKAKGAEGITQPPGFTRIDGNQLKNKLMGMRGIAEDPTSMDKFIQVFLKDVGPGDAYFIDSNIFEMIGVLNKFNQDTTLKTFLNGMDAVNNLFKKTKLLSPGFQMRNIVGNFSNMLLAGMPTPAIFRKTLEADRILRKGEEVFEKVARYGEIALDANEKKVFKYYKMFVENNFEGAIEGVMDIDNIIKKITHDGKDLEKMLPGVKQMEQVMLLNNAMNMAVDSRYRMAMLLYADGNAKFLNKLGADNAVDAVRKVLFDPNDLTAVEKSVYKRMVPFYTFAKKNLVYQAENVFRNPVAYHRLKKTIDGTWRNFAGIDPNNIEAYKRENFWIPLPTRNRNGEYVALKINLPIGDLNDLISSPGRKLLGSLSPVLRSPFELATNQQVFTGMPIESYEGEKGRIFDNMSKKTEYILGQTGLDVPFATVKDLFTVSKGIATGEIEGVGNILQGAVGRSVTSEGSVESAKTSKAYDDLSALQDMIKRYKAEGMSIPTLAEIENQNKQHQSLSKTFSGLLN